MSDEIPFEIQIEIIKKVSDVKSLIRFRSVSKEWKSFIDSSEFIASYGVRNTHLHLLLYRYQYAVDDERYLYFVDDDNDTFTQQRFSSTVSDLIKDLEYSMVIGSSHGLLCFYGNPPIEKPVKMSELINMVVIWNPSIKKSVGVVVPYEFNKLIKITDYGFGVCPLTKDPTIVKISYIENISWQVGLFKLSLGVWNMIPSSNLPRESIRLKRSQVVTNRFIYWAAYERVVDMDGVPRYNHMIMSFDLITNEFRVVDVPDIITNRFYFPFSISKLKESLVLFGYIIENEGFEEPLCGVWKMEYDGVVASFTHLLTIFTPDSSVNNILGCRMNSEIIIETQKEYDQFTELEVYQPSSKRINNLGIGIYGQDDFIFMDSYMESLLLLNHVDCFIYSTESSSNS